MAVIRRVVLRRLRLPLARPYRLSYRTFEEFEPFLIEVEDDDGAQGFADGHISPGSGSETREGGWDFCLRHCDAILGLDFEEAKACVLARFEYSKVAATALTCAIEVMQRSPLLAVPDECRLPLLTPINGHEADDISREVEAGLRQGFRTFKVKVGMDVDADLARVAAIQDAVAGRAALRLDANRAFTRTQGVAFASRLDPSGIDLFEQPCAAEDWESNAAVAAASPVPVMLDEPICSIADIERAAEIEGVGYCKLKLKRFGGLAGLHAGLEAVRHNGMEPVLGDGLGSEVHCWLEACVARSTIGNAGEFNGFLKPHTRLLSPQLPFAEGAVQLPAGYRPSLDRAAIEQCTVETQIFQHPQGAARQ